MMPGPSILRDLEALHLGSFSWSLVCCRGDRGEAEEVLQTTYLKVLDGRARHDGLGDLRPWLFAVIRRTAAGRRRRAAMRRLRLLPGGRAEENTTSEADPEGDACRRDEARRIRQALSRLSQRQREVLELVFYHDLSLRQAAGVMRVTLGAARTHYHRGKQRLRADLQKGETTWPETTSASGAS